MGHYELLRGLYLGQSTTAELIGATERRLLHVRTPLEDLIPTLLARGLDVVLTGNPGDGKSHIVRQLLDAGSLRGVEVELDLSAVPTEAVVARWTRAKAEGTRLLLCANGGPLRSLVQELRAHPQLGSSAAEVRGQLGRLVQPSTSPTLEAPTRVAVLDLADRDLLDAQLVAQAINHVADELFLPDHRDCEELPAGQNIILLLDCPLAVTAMARLICLGGRHVTEHVTFRALWGAISYGICQGHSVVRQKQLLDRGEAGLGSYPIDHLLNQRGQGTLLAAIRRHCDPSLVATPAVDEEIWSRGEPLDGDWLVDIEPPTAPVRLWDRGQRREALEQQRRIKRLLALAHSRGAEILDRLEENALDLPSAVPDDVELLETVMAGISRSYISSREEPIAPAWLSGGLPLWTGHSFKALPVADIPHAVASVAPRSELRITRPVRAPWLRDGFGREPELAWLQHIPTGISMRLDPPLLAQLRLAAATDGPLEPPQRVQRFLTRLAGASSGRTDGSGENPFVVLDRPRGEIVVSASTVPTDGGFSYARA